MPASTGADLKRRQARSFVLKEAAPLLLTLIAGTVAYGLVINRGIGLPILGYNISSAERLLHGEVPYRDFLYNYTPGVLWINALMVKLFGSTVMTVNAGLFIFKLAALLVLFLVARRLTSAKPALIPVALTLGWIGYRVIFRVYPTQYSMLFVLLGLAFMLNYDKSRKERWLLMCGASAGLVFLFKQNVGVMLLGSVTAALLAIELFSSPGRDRPTGRVLTLARRVAVCWLGFALVAAMLVAYVVNAGAFGAMLEHFSSLAANYGENRAITLPHVRLLIPGIVALLAIGATGLIVLRKAPKMFEAYTLFAVASVAAVILIPGRVYALKDSATASMSYLPPALFALVFIVLAWSLRKSCRGAELRELWWRDSGSIAIVALFALGAYSEIYPRADYAHLVRVLPPVFLLLFLLIVRSIPALTTYFDNYLSTPRRAALLCGGGALVLVFVIGIKDAWQPRFDSRLRFVEDAALTTDRARGLFVSRKQKELIDGVDAAIQAHSSVEDKVFSFDPRGTAFYFLSARRNPTKLVWWRSVGIKQEDREAVLEKLGNRIPKLLLIPKSFDNERALVLIEANYRLITSVGDILIYDRNN